MLKTVELNLGESKVESLECCGLEILWHVNRVRLLSATALQATSNQSTTTGSQEAMSSQNAYLVRKPASAGFAAWLPHALGSTLSFGIWAPF